MDEAHPVESGNIQAYQFYVEMALHLHCKDCGEHLELAQDLKEDEQECPYGIWQKRRAKAAMDLGWYVPPLTKEGSLVAYCLCPRCASNKNLKIKRETSDD
ncbi:MAG: hypothetical protein ACN4GF_11480 [Lentimonas sp.]